jgi:hypothetical protein
MAEGALEEAGLPFALAVRAKKKKKPLAVPTRAGAVGWCSGAAVRQPLGAAEVVPAGTVVDVFLDTGAASSGGRRHSRAPRLRSLCKSLFNQRFTQQCRLHGH